MTDDELAGLIHSLRSFDTDSRQVEAKRASWALPARLWQTLSAFSNTPGGGVLILGLDEEHAFAAEGVQDAARTQTNLASISDEMEPTIRPVLSLHVFEGAHLVVAEIPEVLLSQKPCFYKAQGLTNGAYIRVADGNRRLTPYEIQLMLAARGQPRDDELPATEAAPTDLDPSLVAGLLGRLRRPEASPFRGLSDEDALRTLKVLVPHDGRLVPSIGGILALGRYPQAFFPGLSLTFVVYPEAQVGTPGPSGERFLDNRRIEGPIPLMIRPALDALQRNMRRRSRVQGIFREDIWEYPETALREALVNALGHRDLSPFAHGSPVQIQMFPDRLTVINSGGLFGPVTVDRLGDAGVSSSRNATLMKLLEDVVVPGEERAIAENRGSGIGAMLAALRQAGMSPPEFEDEIATFRLTFPNHSLLDADTLKWLEFIGGGTLTDGQAMALALLRRQSGFLTNSYYRRITGVVDSRDATRELRELVRRELLVQIGTRGSAVYRLAPGLTQETQAPRERIVLELRRLGEASRAELSDTLRLGGDAVLYHLGQLMETGTVERTTPPRSPLTRYRLTRDSSQATSATPKSPRKPTRS